jgi:hypothetical protein
MDCRFEGSEAGCPFWLAEVDHDRNVPTGSSDQQTGNPGDTEFRYGCGSASVAARNENH